LLRRMVAKEGGYKEKWLLIEGGCNGKWLLKNLVAKEICCY